MTTLALYFLQHPGASLCASFLFTGLYIFAMYLNRQRGLGSPWIVATPPFVWALNFFWELTRIGKFYAPAVDLRVLYPILFVISVLFTALWLAGILMQLSQDRGSREDVIGKAALRILLSGLEVVFFFIPIEPLLKNRVMFLFPPIFVGPLFFVLSWILSGTFFGGVKGAFAAIFLVGSIEVLLVGLYLFAKKQSELQALRTRVYAGYEAMSAYVRPLVAQIREFEGLAVTKFHAISKDANDTFHYARHISQRLEDRLLAVEKLLSTGAEIELLAAEEVLQTEIDVRESFVDGIQKQVRSSHLDPGEWEATATELSKKMAEILKVLAHVE